MQNDDLLKVAHRLVTDDEYRKWFMTTPKEGLMTELGVSPQVFESLMAVVPVLFAGGIAAVLGDGGEPIHGGWDR